MNAAQYRREHNRQEGQCTWCGGPVRHPRRTWCSDECVHEFRLRHDWPYVRQLVRRRDAGVCADCGLPTIKVQRIIRWASADMVRIGVSYWHVSIRHELCSEMGIDYSPGCDLWAVHHIVPRAEGGSNDLDNLVTLCVACHKKRHARRPTPMPLLDGQQWSEVPDGS